jgi:SSS family solute:Na+ symporter
MAYAAHLKLSSPNDAVPMLFKTLFSEWFAGFAFARDWRAGAGRGHEHRGREPVHAQRLEVLCQSGYHPCGRGGGRQDHLPGGRGRRAGFHPVPPTQFALDLQLLGGLWILQTFPALVFGLFTRWFRAEALLLGWAAAIGWGTWTAWSNGLKPLASLSLGGTNYTFFVGLGALLLNIAVAAIATAIVQTVMPKGATARS